MGKLLFFDIDGTLVGFDRKMPPSAKQALQSARANGHKLFLCTGRSLGEIYPWLIEVGFDGIVAAAGAHVTLDGETILHHEFGAERTKAVTKILLQTNAAFFLERAENCVMTAESAKRQAPYIGKTFALASNEDFLAAFQKILGPVVIDERVSLDPGVFADTQSIIYHEADVPLDEMAKLIAPYDVVVTAGSTKKPDPFSGEITLRGIEKSTGMKAIAERLHARREDIIAFGDGPNDPDMLDFAGVGVCMGNGLEATKKHADIITDDVNENGIFNAMKRLNLI